MFRFPSLKPAQAERGSVDNFGGHGRRLRLRRLAAGDCRSEFSVRPRRTSAAQLHLYNAALHLRYHTPVRSIAILLRPKADVPDLTGNLAYVCGGKRVEFEYDVVGLWKEPVEPFLHGGLGLLPLATLCRMPRDRPLPEALRQVVQQIDRRLLQESGHAQAVRLMTAAFILTGSRVEKEDLPSIYQGVRIMHETTAWDQWLDEGRLEGDLRTSHRLLLRQGRKRFGPADAETESALTSIKDLERLERMAEALLTVNSWQELLSTP